MKVVLDFNLSAWIKGVEVDATSYEDAVAYIEAFITEKFEGGRHQRRVDLIED